MDSRVGKHKKPVARLPWAEAPRTAMLRMVQTSAAHVDTLTRPAALRGTLARSSDLFLRNHIDTRTCAWPSTPAFPVRAPSA